MRQGWEIKQLGDVCQVQRGLTYSGKDTVDYSNTVVLRATNINLESSSLVFDELKYLRDDFEIKENYKLSIGSLLICFSSGSKSHLGKVALIDDEYNYAFGGFIGQLTPTKDISSKYLFYCLISEKYKKYISELTDGVNINNLKIKDLQAFLIPTPSLNEQKRIVAKLDECLEAIGKARANVEKNLNNAKELFQSQLNQIFSQKGEGWVDKKLGEVMKVERGGSPRPIKKYLTDDPNGLNWIKIGDATASDKYIYKTKEKITQDGLHKTRYVEEGDFILSNSMSFGKPYIMKTTGCIHDGWLVLKEKGKFEIEKNYLYHLLCSPNLFSKFDNLAAGSTVRNLNIGLVSSVTIPLPSLTEQKSIVNTLDDLKSQTQSLESNYQQELNALDELKKTILQKAFNGDL